MEGGRAVWGLSWGLPPSPPFHGDGEVGTQQVCVRGWPAPAPVYHCFPEQAARPAAEGATRPDVCSVRWGEWEVFGGRSGPNPGTDPWLRWPLSSGSAPTPFAQFRLQVCVCEHGYKSVRMSVCTCANTCVGVQVRACMCA